jgi:lipoate-protein ligase B
MTTHNFQTQKGPLKFNSIMGCGSSSINVTQIEHFDENDQESSKLGEEVKNDFEDEEIVNNFK